MVKIRKKKVVSFDRYANDYENLLSESISISGEDSEFFSKIKADFLEAWVQRPSDRILDYGCGIGILTRLLCSRNLNVFGFDPSEHSVEIASQSAPSVTFFDQFERVPSNFFDLVVVANVFHHVEPSERLSTAKRIAKCLRPGGKVVVFEHNPLNPLTRYAVSRCEFDEGVELLGRREVKELLSASSMFEVEYRYIIFFPRFLRMLRPFEANLRSVPLGAQHVTVAERIKS